MSDVFEIRLVDLYGTKPISRKLWTNESNMPTPSYTDLGIPRFLIPLVADY